MFWYAIRLVLVFAWVIACVTGTTRRVALSTDERALIADAVRQAPTKPRLWINLGAQYARAGNDLLAENAYRTARALSDNPRRSAVERYQGRVFSVVNLAVLRMKADDLDGAVALMADAMPHPGDPVQSVHEGTFTQWLKGEVTRRSSSH